MTLYSLKQIDHVLHTKCLLFCCHIDKFTEYFRILDKIQIWLIQTVIDFQYFLIPVNTIID